MGKDMPLADLREPEEWAEYARLWPVGDLLSHMLGDNWTFGLLLDNGYVLCIDHLNAVRAAANGAVWLDVSVSARTGRTLAARELAEEFARLPDLCTD